ncbi:hypothetical protein THAOC_23595, partial [Thalassiosira oceanica]
MSNPEIEINSYPPRLGSQFRGGPRAGGGDETGFEPSSGSLHSPPPLRLITSLESGSLVCSGFAGGTAARPPVARRRVSCVVWHLVVAARTCDRTKDIIEPWEKRRNEDRVDRAGWTEDNRSKHVAVSRDIRRGFNREWLVAANQDIAACRPFDTAAELRQRRKTYTRLQLESSGLAIFSATASPESELYGEKIVRVTVDDSMGDKKLRN